MRLHENKRLFKQAVTATAEMMSIPEIFIEKDYWVTYALHIIFNDEIGEQTVFKGGTALSKCFGLIERFSEDIDLVVRHNEGETNNQLTKKIRKIGEVVQSKLPEVEVEGLTRKMGMNRKTAHEYPVTFDGQFGQVRNTIIIEATWFGYFEPYSPHSLSSYIYDMMIKNNQQIMAEEYGMLPFEANVLEPTRTLCEKIMSLVRHSYGENSIDGLRMKIRHIYDLHKMLENSTLNDFFRSGEFETFICRVAQDDVQSFKNNNDWLVNHPAETLMFKDVKTVWGQLRATYTGDFSGLVYGVLPDEADIVGTLALIKERLVGIEWQISLPEVGNE
jgi:hypothetical protein